MSTCAHVRPLLSFFLEKETDPLETLEVRRHLDSCPGCHMRARRMEATMARCDALAGQPSRVDMSGPVMQRLRSLKQAAAAANPALAAKWSGIGLILAAGLTALATPGTPVLGLLARPVAFLVGLATGGDAVEWLRQLAGRALPFLPTTLSTGVDNDVAAHTSLDAALAIQLLATALVFALCLAIPVALLTAWLLHRETAAKPTRQ